MGRGIALGWRWPHAGQVEDTCKQMKRAAAAGATVSPRSLGGAPHDEAVLTPWPDLMLKAT